MAEFNEISYADLSNVTIDNKATGAKKLEKLLSDSGLHGVDVAFTNKSTADKKDDVLVLTGVSGESIEFSKSNSVITLKINGHTMSDRVSAANGFSVAELERLQEILGTKSTSKNISTLDKILLMISQEMNKLFKQIMSMAQLMATGTGIEELSNDQLDKINLGDKTISEALGETKATLKTNDGTAISTKGVLISLKELKKKYADDTPVTLKIQAGKCLLSVNGGVEKLSFESSDFSLDFINKKGGATIQAGKLADIQLQLIDTDGIMENPGTLFLIQQVLSQMKDSLSAVGAVGKVPGDALTQAVQSFQRGVSQ